MNGGESVGTQKEKKQRPHTRNLVRIIHLFHKLSVLPTFLRHKYTDVRCLEKVGRAESLRNKLQQNKQQIFFIQQLPEELDPRMSGGDFSTGESVVPKKKKKS